MKQHTIKLSRLGRVLVSENVARNLRGEIEVNVNRGNRVIVDFEGVAPTTQFVARLLGGLPQHLREKGMGDARVELAGMSEVVQRKVTLVIEHPAEARRPFSLA